MSCKYGMNTCFFRSQKKVCNNCNDADSYEWDESKSHGGKRKGAGRKPSNIKTKNITFRIREEWENTIKDVVRKQIAKLIKK
jgi:hypothetical protein